MKPKTKTSLLIVVNSLLFLTFAVQAGTGMLMGSGLAGEISWNLHGKLGFALVLLVVAHIVLNFSWIKAQIFKSSAKK
ncbi:hypothetical protein K7J14_06070 [Treponema zuelzerae]|uniref:DUF4405 domain-containing protein n=1 Tax=Teretinema zuelzerae TaxID=156 RepID=A0AAE3JIG3_9SPIR|nr:hypothetical protein [Teretinema zuelzerae]MBN2811329.1 hypothetical protein [Spirochaetales bacterium]MCD1654268.1 hypothetical protein [Teretinema zuelzerae]HPO02279.1 hypothetical protein [Treponemataceae bacterium]